MTKSSWKTNFDEYRKAVNSAGMDCREFFESGVDPALVAANIDWLPGASARDRMVELNKEANLKRLAEGLDTKFLGYKHASFGGWFFTGADSEGVI